jgi:GT2 family glycosyltransferase
LEECLRSIFSSVYKDFEVIVIDNASSDGSAGNARRLFPTAEVIVAGTNLGYARGSNEAASRAKGKYLLFLNSDVEIDEHLIGVLVNKMESDMSVGALGAKVLLDRKKRTIDCVGGFECDEFGYGIRPVGHGQVDHGQYDHRSEVFGIAGMCFMTRREVFENVGRFDPSFFLLVEDIDLTWRIRLSGYAVKVEPSATIVHRSMGTFSKERVKRERVRYLAERNTLRMLLKNYSRSTLLTVLPRYFATLVAETLFYLLLRKPQMAGSNIRAVWWNISQRDTYAWRRYVQSNRKVGDKDIRLKMVETNLKIDLLKRFLAGTFNL